MRGKVSVKLDALATAGITPAYAGKSFGLDIAAATVRDHPRLCGEKAEMSEFALFFEGSPPPMRGKAFSVSGCSLSPRITPAYAGKRLDRLRCDCKY